MDKISLRVTDGKNIVTALLKNAIVAKIDIQEAFTKSSIREECLITIDKKDFTNAVEKITKVFEPKKRFKIHVHRLSGFGDISTEKMLVAIRLLECVINSSKFPSFTINGLFTGPPTDATSGHPGHINLLSLSSSFHIGPLPATVPDGRPLRGIPSGGSDPSDPPQPPPSVGRSR